MIYAILQYAWNVLILDLEFHYGPRPRVPPPIYATAVT